MQNLGWIYPQTADNVLGTVGVTLREFQDLKETLARYKTFMDATDLTTLSGWPQAPAVESTAQSNLQAAVNTLNAALQAFDPTFVNRVTGLY